MCLAKSLSGIKTMNKQLVILLGLLTEAAIPKHMNIHLVVNLLFMMYSEVTYFFEDQSNAS